MGPPVIVTRPAQAGQRLQRRLTEQGYDAHWWPAFQFGPPPDEQRARATLADVGQFDLAIFVSPQAVEATRSLARPPWPESVLLGAVGSGTAAAVRDAFRPTRLLTPPADGAGSEGLWSEWVRRGEVARQVLILRAQHGREWLAERFGEVGTAVTELAVYTRIEIPLDPSKVQWLATAVGGPSPTTIVSSSEAIAAIERKLDGLPAAIDWLKRGIAVATHPRIGARLLDSGYTRVELSSADDDALVTRLESLQPPRSAER